VQRPALFGCSPLLFLKEWVRERFESVFEAVLERKEWKKLYEDEISSIMDNYNTMLLERMVYQFGPHAASSFTRFHTKSKAKISCLDVY
jgi:hypothetical protein